MFPSPVLPVLALGAASLAWLPGWCRRRYATWRATAWTPVLSRLLSRVVGNRDYSDDEFYGADGAPAPVVTRRRAALRSLVQVTAERHPRIETWEDELKNGLSDLRFTDATRVPFPFARMMRDVFQLSSVVDESRGPWLRHTHGRWTLDVSGAYGLNVAGFDRYKEWITRGWQRVQALGPVLGPLHPIVADNVRALKAVSGLDEVSFHMSGTEAVMAAVRSVRFNTRRKLIVCFAGAYHGWWDGVQPGLGSERSIDDCLTLKDMDPASLDVVRLRAREIAGVLVNPIQSFHPNTPPPNDAVLMTSDVRRVRDTSDAYAAWLQALRRACTEADVPLIFDEVYTGFRLAPGGAQEYFQIQADVVVYGKTVAGGLPIGVVCGKRTLMRRFDPRHPMRMAYLVGTFSAHPAVMGAMFEFLAWARTPEAASLYETTNRRCVEWVARANERLHAEGLPIRIGHLGTIWTVLFTEPGRFHWLLQYYLRAEGLTLSWVGTGRCLISMDFAEDDYSALTQILVDAALAMKRDGWWPTAAEHPERDRRMRQQLVRDAVASVVRVPAPLSQFYRAVMKRKHDDHRASHNHRGNQALHLLSSAVFVACYWLIWRDVTVAMSLGLAALLVRQFGHAILEPPCHDAETLLLGFTTRAKTLIVLGYGLLAVFAWVAVPLSSGVRDWSALFEATALHWFRWTLAVVLGRVVFLSWKFDVTTSMIWFVKLVTDPFTDLMTYRPWRSQAA
ncbi:MAG: aminotransferase class III-fold pyridoxal phosphate-dependent enzyme [Vicinamibacterales bacterium]